MAGTSLVAGEICAKCNNAWMSALEVSAKPYIISPPDRILDPAEARMLAQWFIKTAIVINVSHQYRLLWASDRRHDVARQQMPNVAAWLYRVPDSDLNWIQGRPGVPTLLSNPEQGISTETAQFLSGVIHNCSIQAGTLVGDVLAYPGEIAASEFEHAGTLLWKDDATCKVNLTQLATGKDLWDHGAHIELKTSAFWSGSIPAGYSLDWSGRLS